MGAGGDTVKDRVFGRNIKPVPVVVGPGAEKIRAGRRHGGAVGQDETGETVCQCRLADPLGAGNKPGMGHAAALKGIPEKPFRAAVELCGLSHQQGP